jgi:PAS domain S-box-containing protein
MPWGTHFCHFYDSKQDLLDTLVPYFKAGLEDKEFCVWVIADPLTKEEAWNALRLAVPDLDRHLADQSIEMFVGEEWYLKNDTFNLQRVTSAWNEKLEQALARGYEGMRVSGDTCWLREKDWQDFCAYEKYLNESISDLAMTVLCTYPLAKSGAAEILDVARTHQFCLTRRSGNWEVIEAPEIKLARQEIEKLNEALEGRVTERTRQLTALNHELRREIIERELAEELLREANDKVELILGSITDAFFGFSKDFRFTYLNKHAAEQMKALGKDPASLIGKVLWDEFPFVPNEEAVRRVMSERVAITDEFFYAPLGEWVENHMYPSHDGGMVTFQKYVTGRKRAEKNLLESERKFAVIFYKAAFAIALARLPEGFIVDINEAWMRLFGFNREEAVGKTSLELGINRDPEGSTLLFEELQEKGSVRNREMSFFTKAGAERVISCNMDVVMFGGQKYLVSTMHDVTEHKRAEAERRRGEAYLAEGQRLSHTGSWAWNVSSGEIYWSLEHFRVFGLDPEIVKPTYDAMIQWSHPEDRSLLQETFEKAVRERTQYELAFRIVCPDGTVKHIHSLAHPVFNAAGELTEYVGTMMDITERKLNEEALQKALAELAHVNRVLTVGELTASIAHEVNQPLGAIVTNGNASLRLMSRETPDLEGSREGIECMISDAMRASEVIQRIRALLKKTTPEKKPLNINETTQEVIGLSAGQLAMNQVVLRTELATNPPHVLGDRVQLQQVLLNLILNANEAMSKPGWQPRELTISSQESDSSEVTVAVRDSGVGVRKEDEERIFDAFVTSKEGGLGLGLSLSRTIIEAHGGRLWTTPNEEQGATFMFTLPTSSES